ncbi:glycosyltransferase family 4 protein [Nostoc cycadae]|uniref:Glycosyl transferase family 1 n=1 Tax=Nostoc cycadae WK-1 TaxID=1861711 RepID=A0A2H6LC08_9NOSO|nr:glycosyltransferase family 4 protein [Nostoc cycadae]GBE90774.1 glycosyl transferase family 1 [Nostoc cycadae WK-1]
MMKVALLHFCFEDYTIELANSLVKYVNLTLIHPEKVSAVCRNDLDPNIHVISFKKPRIRDPRNLLSMSTMMRSIQEVQPDVLHVQETNDPWYDLALLFNQMPPLVTTIHDVYRHPGDRQSVFGSEYTRRVAFSRSQQLIVHTEGLKQALIQDFQVPKQRVNVLNHGELGSLYQRRAKTKTLAREPYTLLFFGRIWPYKGLNYLLKAMPLIAAKIPEVKLIIAGRGENIQQYFPHGYDHQQIEIINDFIPEEDVAGLFQRSTISVLPYIEASQSGVAALSYGIGTPIVASDVGGLREIIKPEKDGILVPPGDVEALANAIIRLLSDRTLQQQMQTAALARCQHDLNWSNIAEQTFDVYHHAIKRI